MGRYVRDALCGDELKIVWRWGGDDFDEELSHSFFTQDKSRAMRDLSCVKKE